VSEKAAGDALTQALKLAEEAPLKVVIHLPKIGGVDMSINMLVITMWVAVLAILLFIFAARRNPKLVPGPIQTLGEFIIFFIRDSIVMDMMGKNGLGWVPFLATLFLFILFCNILGMIPGLATPTGNINVTATLAIMVFLSVHIAGSIKHGPLKYLRALVLPTGVPLWLAPLFIPLELISAIAKPFSLTVRLFANMFAGHTVLVVFVGLILLYASYVIAPFPLLLSVAVGLLEIGFKILQAYVFTVLSAMYIGDALHGGH
jgi:F-type H+-transporting ATPase subunit a